MLRVTTNVPALHTLRTLRSTDDALARSLERLSAGQRVNRASDDAAGLSISEGLRAQIRGAQRAGLNIQDGVSMVNTAEGALTEVHAILQRMRELAVQSSNGTLSASDRNALQGEFAQLQAEIGNISSYTTFNGLALFSGVAGGFATNTFATSLSVPTNAGTTNFALNGPAPPLAPSALGAVTITATSAADPGPPPAPPVVTALTQGVDYTITATPQGFNGTTQLYSYTVTLNNTALMGPGPYSIAASATMTYPTSTLSMPITIQSGANMGNIETLSFPPMNAAAIGVGSASLGTQALAMAAITAVSNAIGSVSTMRSGLGASANSLGYAAASVAIAAENLAAANARIRDADMAQEMTELTRRQILMRSGMGMLSVANDSSTILQLMGG